MKGLVEVGMARTPWSSDEINFLVMHVNNLTPIEIFERYVLQFGTARTYDAVQKQCKKLKAVNAVVEIFDEEELDIEVDFVENENVVLPLPPILTPTATSVLKKKYDEEIRDFVNGLAKSAEDTVFTRPDIFVGDGASLCILLSDTHFGKLTKHFNMHEANKRIMSIPDKIVELGIRDLDEVVIMLGGDMIEGEDIYATQSHHIEDSAIKQVMAAVDSFWNLGVKLSKQFPGLKVRYVTVPGNHGRVSKTAAEETNWDNIIYQMLGQIALAFGDKSITVDVNFQTFHTFDVKGKTGMMYHHGTKHTGTPAMQVRLVGWMQQKHWDFMCHGHWHQWEIGTQFGKPVMKNGSLPGEDDLAERMGVFDPPRQGWMLIRKDQPINQFGFFEWGNE